MVVSVLRTSGSGYTYVESPDERPVYIHRLVAVAHGKMESLGDGRDVHHKDGITWVNSPENLTPVPPWEHRRRTLQHAD